MPPDANKDILGSIRFETRASFGEHRPGGKDDDLGPGRGDAHLHPRVAVLGQLPSQKLIQLSLEDPVRDELQPTNARGEPP